MDFSRRMHAELRCCGYLASKLVGPVWFKWLKISQNRSNLSVSSQNMLCSGGSPLQGAKSPYPVRKGDVWNLTQGWSTVSQELQYLLIVHSARFGLTEHLIEIHAYGGKYIASHIFSGTSSVDIGDFPFCLMFLLGASPLQGKKGTCGSLQVLAQALRSQASPTQWRRSQHYHRDPVAEGWGLNINTWSQARHVWPFWWWRANFAPREAETT